MGEPIEERMMAEWAAGLLPGTWKTHVRLGRVRAPADGHELTNKELEALRVTLPEADLIRHVDLDLVEIVEFIVWRPHETLGQLLYYGGLLAQTPGYLDVPADKIRLRIVTALEDPAFRTFAETLGIAFEIYRPAWLEEALAARRGGR